MKKFVANYETYEKWLWKWPGSKANDIYKARNFETFIINGVKDDKSTFSEQWFVDDWI